MGAKLLGYHIIRKSDGKKAGYIGVIPMMNKKVVDDWMKKFPPSRFHWVESRAISSPKSSKYCCK
jgi:hypothetical protein